MRESLSIRLYKTLRDQGASIAGHDFLAVREAIEIAPGLEASSDLEATLNGADVVVALNAEPAYSSLDWSRLISQGCSPYVIDTRGILDAGVLSACGITFDVLGSTI